MKYNIIVCDPPYEFSDKIKMRDGVKRGAEDNYDTLTFDDLMELPIKEISAENALLALWVPSTLLPQGLKLMEKYGFKFKQTFIWVKTKTVKSLIKFCKNQVKSLFQDFTFNDNILSMGMGHLFRQSHEICIIGVKGKGIYKQLKNKSQRSVALDFNEGHSIKPDTLQNRLEKMFYGEDIKRLEIFARRSKDGWTCIGNQVEGATFGEDIRVSLKNMID